MELIFGRYLGVRNCLWAHLGCCASSGLCLERLCWHKINPNSREMFQIQKEEKSELALKSVTLDSLFDAFCWALTLRKIPYFTLNFFSLLFFFHFFIFISVLLLVLNSLYFPSNSFSLREFNSTVAEFFYLYNVSMVVLDGKLLASRGSASFD